MGDSYTMHGSSYLRGIFSDPVLVVKALNPRRVHESTSFVGTQMYPDSLDI